MTIDLQEQLRDLADTLVGCEWNHPLCSEETCRSAAAQIEKVTLENERLRGELHKTSQGLYATGRAEIEKLRQQLAAQMVEIERLQGELAKCRRLLREVCRDPERVEVDGVRCWEIITTDEWMQAAQAAGGEW